VGEEEAWPGWGSKKKKWGIQWPSAALRQKMRRGEKLGIHTWAWRWRQRKGSSHGGGRG